MLNAVIERYDKECHAVVVGAPIFDTDYRVPILNFWREGDARLFCNYLRRYSYSRTVQLQLEGLAKQYNANRHKLVSDFDFRIHDGEIKSMTIKRLKPSQQ